MPEVTKPIVVVGSINVDLVTRAERIPSPGETVRGTSFQTHPGGKGANQAVAVARLGYPVELIGMLGNDLFGSQLRSHLLSAGVGLQGVAEQESSSGTAIIIVAENGENSIVVTSGANALVKPSYVEANLGLIRNAGMVLAQLEIPVEAVECLASICARENIPLILDPAPATDLPPEIFRHIDWFTPNQTEAVLYSGNHGTKSPPAEMAAKILARGCRGVLLKMGSQGAYLELQTGNGRFIPAFPVNAIDTTAAGDAFNGGFATGLMLGKSPSDSAMFAAAVAGLSVTRIGAQPSMPTMSEVKELLETEYAKEVRG